jgi:replicative DNA helicase
VDAEPEYIPENDIDETMLSERRLPHDLEAEQAVLSSLLLAPDRFDLVEGRLLSDDFFSQAYGAIFEAMIELGKRGQPIDILLLKDELARKSKLDLVGGAVGLASIHDSMPTGAHVEYYAGLVREKSILRRLIQAATTIVEKAGSATETATDILESAEQAVFEVATRGTSAEAESIGQVLKTTWEKIEKFRSNRGSLTGLSTGYYELDDKLTGLHEDELIIVAGRPAMGKSTFVLNLIRNVGVAQGLPAVLYTLEMSAENIVQNVLCAQSKLDAQKLRKMTLTEEDNVHLLKSSDLLNRAPIWIDDTPAISLAELRGKTRRLKAKHDIQLCVIDYLQLMMASSQARNRSREQEIGEISRGLKALAKELKIPVIALSQLNRKAEDRSDNRPILSDLRESGSIEQDADVVILLHRPDYYDSEDSPGQAEIIVAKQRNGPTGTVNLTFIGNQLRFENLSARPVSGFDSDEDL